MNEQKAYPKPNRRGQKAASDVQKDDSRPGRRKMLKVDSHSDVFKH